MAHTHILNTHTLLIVMCPSHDDMIYRDHDLLQISLSLSKIHSLATFFLTSLVTFSFPTLHVADFTMCFHSARCWIVHEILPPLSHAAGTVVA